MTSATATADTIGEALDRQATERLTKTLCATCHQKKTNAEADGLAKPATEENAKTLGKRT